MARYDWNDPTPEHAACCIPCDWCGKLLCLEGYDDWLRVHGEIVHQVCFDNEVALYNKTDQARV